MRQQFLDTLWRRAHDRESIDTIIGERDVDVTEDGTYAWVPAYVKVDLDFYDQLVWGWMERSQ